MKRSIVAVCVHALLAIPALAFAQRQSAITETPDGNQILVQKDVGAERWAIAMNNTESTINGNVYPVGGGPATFLTCKITGHTTNEILLSCRAMGNCASSKVPCTEQWGSPQEATVPKSFFELPGPPVCESFGTCVGSLNQGKCDSLAAELECAGHQFVAPGIGQDNECSLEQCCSPVTCF